VIDVAINVTTGERGSVSVESSTMSNRPSSTSAPHALTYAHSSRSVRGVGVDHVGDLVHRALFHQKPDDVDRAFGHAVASFLDVDGFRDHHLANSFLSARRRIPFRRWVRRRNEAIERSRTSSALSR